jgi:amyloid beta (A4) precursor protein-binding family B protein 2 (Fe65-like)
MILFKGKDLYLDLQDNLLMLTDPIDDKVLNKQPISSIRVWGVGRDNAR